MIGSMRARSSGFARDCAAAWRVELALERLEELLLLSGDPVDPPADWRQETFSLGNMDLQAQTPPLAAQSFSGLGLIGGDLEQQRYGFTGAGYSVAILDTGIDYTNPAFAGRYLGGWNFIANNNNPMDDEGHGTHVAGIIASADPNHLGVAPGVGIIALKVLDSTGTGDFGNVDLALQWVAAHQQQYHIAAVNMSLGAGNYQVEPWSFLDADFQQLQNEGVFVAASSGNSYYSYGSQPGLAFPAINNLVVSVGAVYNGNYGSVSWANGAKDYSTAPDQITSFTQRNSQLDILAPGAFITSTYLGGGWATMAGTSMAAPMVAGAAVVIHQALDAAGEDAQATQSGILSIMQHTGVSIVDANYGQDNVVHTGQTYQRLDLYNAVQSIVTGGTWNRASAPADPNLAYVDALYEELLGRPADPGGLNTWVAALESGMSRMQLVELLWNSAEHRAFQVDQDYAEFLHREPSDAERSHWATLLMAGVSETQVAEAFLHSPEFLLAESTTGSFVQSLFQDVLGRSADSGSLAALTELLDLGISRGQIADLVLNSLERDADVVDSYYQEFLGRGASNAELMGWANAIAHGVVDLQTVGEAFLASGEFFNRAASGGVGGFAERTAGAGAALGYALADTPTPPSTTGTPSASQPAGLSEQPTLTMNSPAGSTGDGPHWALVGSAASSGGLTSLGSRPS
ncbi:MAG TPA: S8 family serine peptidase [Pirellulales bacterium]